MAMGERTPLAALGSASAPASGRMAVGEAITNLLAAPIELPRVKLSANWMAACGEPGEDAALFDTVRAVGLELCPALGIGIPVGKDSLSMRTRWGRDRAGDRPGVAHRHRLCDAGRRARHADAATAGRRHHADPRRSRPRPHAHGRLDAGAGAGAVRRRGRPTSTTRSSSSRWWPPSTPCAPKAACWPTTTAATAACGRRCARWPLPAISA